MSRSSQLTSEQLLPGARAPQQLGSSIVTITRLANPGPEAKGRLFSSKVEAFCAYEWEENETAFQFADAQCTGLIEIYISMR